jgi:hypothetical protein
MTDPYPDLPLPAGAAKVGDWDDPNPWRRFYGPGWLIKRTDEDDVEIIIVGIQYTDGRIERGVELRGYGGPLTAAQTRQLARILIAAAAEMEQMAQYDIEVTR